MCGFTVHIKDKNYLEESLDQFIVPRGTEEIIVWEDDFVRIQHVLLPIQSNISQPLVDKDYVLAYNGEIYNLEYLKEKYGIEEGANDTEVLFFLLSNYGVEIIKELEGMFAFVWYLRKDKIIYAAVDYFGQKPLFYGKDKGKITCLSSSHESIRNYLKVNSTSHQDVRKYLSLKYSKTSIFKDIFRLSARKILVLNLNDCDKEPEVKEYDNKQCFGKIDLNLLLQESVKEQIHQSPAVFFSGGMDSAIILYLLHELNLKPIAYTYDSSKFKGLEDDVKYAKDFCKKLGIEHHLIKATASDWDDFCSNLDYPIGDSALFLQWVVAKEVRKKHTVVFSGIGADELFLGYNRHKAVGFYLNQPFLRKLMALFSYTLPRNLPWGWVKAIKVFRKKRLFLFHELQKSEVFDIILETKIESLPDVIEHEIQNYLVFDGLSVNDQACMAHNLECRQPFLNKQILEFALKQPEIGKKLLKSIFNENSALKPILNRKKQGYGVPFGAFFEEERVTNIMNECYLNLKNFVTESEWKRLFDFPKKYSNEWWSLLILKSYLDKVNGNK